MKFKYINAFELSLHEWIELLKDPPENTIFNQWSFPTNEMADEYITDINNRSYKEVYFILNAFLISTCWLESDKSMINFVKEQIKSTSDVEELFDSKPYYKRIFQWSISEKLSLPWEGITWILHLLPNRPKEAIASISNYLLAHFIFLPDGRINGLHDAMAVIRAKFIGLPQNNVDKISFLLDMTSREFEHVVESLYHAMGYKTKLTPGTRDGGHDVIAVRSGVGQKEIVSVECKLHRRSVGIAVVDRLRGVILRHGSNRGVIFTTGKYTRPAQEAANSGQSIELVQGDLLTTLLNEHFGPEWPSRIDSIISQSQRRQREAKAADDKE